MFDRLLLPDNAKIHRSDLFSWDSRILHKNYISWDWLTNNFYLVVGIWPLLSFSIHLHLFAYLFYLSTSQTDSLLDNFISNGDEKDTLLDLLLYLQYNNDCLAPSIHTLHSLQPKSIHI